jgi:hypothetical protein
VLSSGISAAEEPGVRMRLAAAAEVPATPLESAEPVEDLTPSELTVEVAVEVGFRIS